MSQVATAKQTGGGGFTYEDKVGAYFLVCMLTETPPFQKDYGVIEKIKFQVRVDGWLFDDLLLSMKTAGKSRRIAISVKSGQQLTTNGIPADLNMLLWQQYRKEISDVFQVGQDALCLVEPPLATGLSDNLHMLLREAYEQEAGEMNRRQETEKFSSVERRRIYHSFACPPALTAMPDRATIQTGDVLKSFLHIQMDFEAPHSTAEQRAIGFCRDALQDPQLETASQLYKRLCGIVREQSGVAGYIDIPKLVEKLGGQFQLKDFPSYVADWQRLEQHTRTRVEVILDSIGNRVELPRQCTMNAITDKLNDSKAIILNGISGSGKSVLAKKLAQEWQGAAKVIWLDSSDFDVPSWETALGLTNSLHDVIRNVATRTAYLIIDGAEKLYAAAQHQRMAALCKFLLQTPNWKILLTCPSESLSSVLEKLHQCNLNTLLFTPLPMTDLQEEEMTMLTEVYPALVPFVVKSNIRMLLNNLKLLDKLVIHMSAIHLPEEQELGETTLIDFIWEEEITKTRDGIAKGKFLQLMAEKQADNLSLSVSDAEFGVPELGPVEELRKARFIQYRQDRLYFAHDLYGDWARYKLLLAHRTTLQDFLHAKHLSSPLWARAIRYYAMSLLEKEGEVDTWRVTFAQFDGRDPEHVIIQDLMLEAIFFSHNAFHHLLRYKAWLFGGNGVLFRRLIMLFDRRATMANPAVLELSGKLGLEEATAVTINRLPIWHYWLDVLQFIHLHRQEAIALDAVGVGKLAHTWIIHTMPDFHLRKEASDIALLVVRNIKGIGYGKEGEKGPIYEAMLWSFQENPEEIKTLCRQLCRRIPPGPPQKEDDDEEVDFGDTSSFESTLRPLTVAYRKAVQWEDGPYERVDGIWQETVLNTQAISPIMVHDPALATEILLAVLIDEPHERYGGRGHRDYCLFEPWRWNPPFYKRGPFLFFFRVNPWEALKFTLKLIDFATNRKLDAVEANGVPEGITVVYEGQIKLYKGDQEVFGWHKDIGEAPHVVVSLLMTMEQFLYEEIEKGESVREYVRHAVAHTNSLAIVGVVLVVAKIQPDLYQQELRHLLPVYEWYAWDHYSHSYDDFTFWRELPVTWHAEVNQWKAKKHRFWPLKDVLLRYWFGSTELQQDYVVITRQWEERWNNGKAAGNDDVYLLQMIQQFKKENWQTDGETVSYVEPAYITAHLRAGRESSLETIDYGNFAFRCEQAINENKGITLQEAEQIWSKLQAFLLALEADDAKDNFDIATWASPYTNITAAMAILLHFTATWQEVHPEYYITIKQFSHQLMNKVIWTEVDRHRTGTGHDWHTFLAIIAARLWMEDEKDVDCRRMVAGVAVQFDGKTMEKLLFGIGRYREWQDPGFVQLQNFLVRFSTAYHLYLRSKHDTDSSFQVTKLQLIDQFTEGRVSLSPDPWSAHRALERKKTKGRKIRPELLSEDDYTRSPGLYTPVLMHMLQAVPELEAARSDAERKHIVYLYKQGLGQLVYELGDVTEAAQPVDHFPDDFNFLILKRVATLLPFLTEEEQPASFWEPLLQYGCIAPKWVDQFCTNFFLYNIEKPDRQLRMVQLLENMVSFSEGCRTWKAKHAVVKGEDFRLCLLGVQPRLISIWKDDLTRFTHQATHLYQQWFLKKRINPYAIIALLDFVVTRSGEFMLKEALGIMQYFALFEQKMAEADRPQGLVYRGVPNLEAKLANVLGYIWKNKKTMLQANRAMLTVYRDLVKYLVAQRNITAMELQNELQVGI